MPFWPFKRSQQQSMNTFLIVGLGNIGIDYKNTRHNIGFTVLDAVATQVDVSFSTLRYGDLAEMSHKGKKIVLLKPSTLMNRSGQVNDLCSFRGTSESSWHLPHYQRGLHNL